MIRQWKILVSAVLFFLMVGCVFGICPSCCFASQTSSPVVNDTIPWQALDGGGAVWVVLQPSGWKISSSLGQSIAGVQGKGACAPEVPCTLYTGFWNPRIVMMTPVEWEEEDFSQLPKEFDIRQNYPNPFNPTTVIQYALPKTSFVKITIYNVLGQRVRNLVDEEQGPGYKKIHWDGRDDAGVEVSSGVYFYRIKAGDFVECKKMTLLK